MVSCPARGCAFLTASAKPRNRLTTEMPCSNQRITAAVELIDLVRPLLVLMMATAPPSHYVASWSMNPELPNWGTAFYALRCRGPPCLTAWARPLLERYQPHSVLHQDTRGRWHLPEFYQRVANHDSKHPGGQRPTVGGRNGQRAGFAFVQEKEGFAPYPVRPRTSATGNS